MPDIGPMLGRLTSLRDPNSGQEFPLEWKQEMEWLSDVGADCVEWIVVDEEHNPLYDDIDLSSYPIVSINIHSLTQTLLSTKFLDNICHHANRHGINRLVLPLLEESSVSSDVMMIINEVARKHPSLSFSLETNLPAKVLLQSIENSENIFVTYDTGNSTAENLCHEEEIALLGSKIDNVHLKDRLNNGGPNVRPFSGDTDFKLIFDCLREIGYDKNFILETYRGPVGEEKETITEYIEEFRCLI